MLHAASLLPMMAASHSPGGCSSSHRYSRSLPLALGETAARAGTINPLETAATLPDAIKFVPCSGGPPDSGEMAARYGGLDQAGPYLVLMKWHPGHMTAPQSFLTDRISLVASGACWDPRRPPRCFQRRLRNQNGLATGARFQG